MIFSVKIDSMKTYIKFYRQLLITTALLVLSIASLYAQSTLKEPASLTECKERLFWRIDGIDQNGNPSTLYIQGTIHIGDKKLLKVPGKVMKAFSKADRYVGEISTDHWGTAQQLMVSMVKDSYDENRNIMDHLSPEGKRVFTSIYPLPVLQKKISGYEPWVITMTVTQNVYKMTELDPVYALDSFFEGKVKEAGYKTEGLDLPETQLSIMRFENYESQLKILESTLKEYPYTEIAELIKKMYQAYLKNDKAALLDAIMQEEEQDTQEDAELAERYHKKLYVDRNQAWAEKFENYLNQGGTTFIFAGSAHFLGEESVFAFMKERGSLK